MIEKGNPIGLHLASRLKEETAASVGDTRQLWVCHCDSQEGNVRSSPLVAVSWNLPADRSWKSHRRPSLLPRHCCGCRHLMMFKDDAFLEKETWEVVMEVLFPWCSSLLFFLLFTHHPSLSTVKSSLEKSQALLLSFFSLTSIPWLGPSLPPTWITPTISRLVFLPVSSTLVSPACTC